LVFQRVAEITASHEAAYQTSARQGAIFLRGGGISSSLADQLYDEDDDESTQASCKGAADGIESFLLALACEGVNVCTPEFSRALETTVEGIANNM
jgi:hypothetical protein